MKVAVMTLGCKVNQSESATLEKSLEAIGINIVKLNDKPDICIVNTCTVTAKGDYSSRQMVRKAVNTGAKVFVTGCYSQLNPENIKNISGRAEIVDNNEKLKIVEYISGRAGGLRYDLSSRARPYLKVQDGCNNHCSYCAVPFARGKSRSITIEDAVNRAIGLETQGFREIVVTGIHLGSYGAEFTGKSNLVCLMRELLSKTLRCRFRLSSLEINDISDELLEMITDNRICRHLHIPLQSGSEKVLRLMRRRYTPEDFSRKLQHIINRVENISVGTDIIAGFPGEDQKAYEETRLIVEEIPFSYLHVFPYSQRPGTEAFNFNNIIGQSAVKNRIEELRESGIRKKQRFMNSQLGKLHEIVVESKERNNFVLGTSSNYLRICSSSSEHQPKSLINIRSNAMSNDMLFGDVIN